MLFIQCNKFRCSSTNNIQINNIIYEKKGYNDSVKKRLKPMILHSNDNIGDIVGINKTNTMVTINEDGFCLLTITKEGAIKIDPIVKDFPPNRGTSIHSDSRYNIVWMQSGRGLYFLDVETKKTGHCNAAPGLGNNRLGPVFLADPEKKIFLITILEPFKKYKKCIYYILYDLNADKIIFTSPKYQGFTFPFEGKILFKLQEFNAKKDDYEFIWRFVDIYMNKLEENKLTKEMNRYDIRIASRSNSIHPERRMILGVSWVAKQLVYYSIRWDEKFENIDISPLRIQRPKGKLISDLFIFSPDGRWIKTHDVKVKNSPQELLMYHTGSIYPQGVNIPILCGYTNKFNRGVFIEHEKWGPCYVEQDYNYPDRLFLFKLNDGLKTLAEK